MPLRKDYLLDQLRDFFAALNRIATRIEAGELDRAEEEIDALASAVAIEELLRASSGAVSEHAYAAWKFQVQLLLLKVRVLEARGAGGLDAAEVVGADAARAADAAPRAAEAVRAAESVRAVEAARARAVEALRKLIGLRPEVYDIELAEQLRGMEKGAV